MINKDNKLTHSIDALLDTDIVASAGANPFSGADKSGGNYIIKVFPVPPMPRKSAASPGLTGANGAMVLAPVPDNSLAGLYGARRG